VYTAAAFQEPVDAGNHRPESDIAKLTPLA